MTQGQAGAFGGLGERPAAHAAAAGLVFSNRGAQQPSAGVVVHAQERAAGFGHVRELPFPASNHGQAASAPTRQVRWETAASNRARAGRGSARVPRTRGDHDRTGRSRAATPATPRRHCGAAERGKRHRRSLGRVARRAGPATGATSGSGSGAAARATLPWGGICTLAAVAGSPGATARGVRSTARNGSPCAYPGSAVVCAYSRSLWPAPDRRREGERAVSQGVEHASSVACVPPRAVVGAPRR
jgi:hypothetical protein